MKPTLSIIVAAHHEGLIAHKTMLSLIRSLHHLDDHSISYEVIITIDRGDKTTLEYFDRYSNNSTITVHKINFGDLALSRNYGVSISQGKYIATLDADDLVSEKWLIDGVHTLQNTKERTVLHTQYSINFGTQDIIWEKFNSRSKEEDALIMTWANRWDSAVIAPRSIFEQYPYLPNIEGYGSEDWHFNSQTLAADIPHKVVPCTILFVRRKDVSLMTIQAADRSTLRYTDLLDINFMKKIDISLYIPASTVTPQSVPSLMERAQIFTKKSILYVHRQARNYPVYTKATKHITRNIRKYYLPKQKPQKLPSWLIDEWRAIHAIDKSIFPDKQLTQSIPLYHSEMYELGGVFHKLATYLSRKPNYIMFVPHLTKGGAEHVALRYVSTIRKNHPDWHLAVVATELGDNPWRNQLPKDVDFIPYGELTHHFPEQLRLQLLARFITQSQATHLHIAQSPLMFRFAELYRTFLQPYIVYAFAFCEDTDKQGRIAGHVHSGLPLVYDSVDSIFTDNNSIITTLQNEYGYSGEKFKTHYQPVDVKILKPQIRDNTLDMSLRVLWASRIAKQKRPDVLIDIAHKLSAENIHIDVYGSLQDGYTEKSFNELSNVTYKGHFNGVESLPTNSYDVFLYTSENDGIPNILLEITARGLPIIAPNIGGIAEFISAETGILISKSDAVDSYAEAIKTLYLDKSRRLRLAKNAQKVLMTQHSCKQFEDSLKRDIS